MNKKNALARSRSCFAPEINSLITAYCFGRASEDEQRTLEIHVLECDYCWREVQRLEQALHVLSSERNLMNSISASDAAHVLGISNKIDLPFGGHVWHVIISCVVYAGLYGITLLMEIAYRFDLYGPTAMKLLPVVFFSILGTSVVALGSDCRRTTMGKAYGLGLSLLIFLMSAGVLFAALSLFLPVLPITEMTTPSSSAQSAYLKDTVYSLLVVFIFLAPTFHFIVAMQRELKRGRYKPALELLTGGKFGISPRGAIYPTVWMLLPPLIIMATYSAFSTKELLGHLNPSRYQNLFVSLIWLRLILHYGLALKCWSWYQRALNDLKLECLVAETTTPN